MVDVGRFIERGENRCVLFELCRRLRKIGRLVLADATVSTSARRFAKLGVLRTYWRMWWVTTRYRLGAAPQDLRRLYERQ